MRIVVPLVFLLFVSLPASASSWLDHSVDVREVGGYSEEIFVVGDAPLVEPVSPGEPVRVVFSVGELDVRAEEVREVRAEIEVTCPPARKQRCGEVRKKLRIEPRRSPQGLEIRMTGVRRQLLRRLEVRGTVSVPVDSPLDVKIGIGDADVHAGERETTVTMGIGDLTVYAPEAAVGSVDVRTRIGDASMRLPGEGLRSKRKALIGARARWQRPGDAEVVRGQGSEPIHVRLKIGDARVILQ